MAVKILWHPAQEPKTKPLTAPTWIFFELQVWVNQLMHTEKEWSQPVRS
jgi:hypothetical protein